MHIAVIGTGYVGLVSGTCFSEFGHDVICIDTDAGKIDSLNAGEVPIFEPGLQAMIEKNTRSGYLKFGTDLKSAVAGADAVFIAVGTPSRRGDGQADLTYVYAAAKEIAAALSGYTVVVTKSTVPVGTGREVERILHETNPDADFDVVSNPEFLREGAAIEDFMRPDRVIVGTTEPRAQEVMSAIYRPLSLFQTPLVFTSLESSELTKYAGNAFLATKITFINEIADLCEKVGANVHDVARGIGLDGRIGAKFLHPGPGFGGSCFPKDTRALYQTSVEAEAPMRIVDTVIDINEKRKMDMAARIVDACGGSVSSRKIAVLGLTFKPNTDDMRESPSLDIIPALVKAGAVVRAYDPEGMEEARKLLDDVEFCDSSYATIEGADALVIITEWNEFRALDLKRVKSMMKTPVMVDLRNIYDPHDMAIKGFTYRSIGRPT
ncbi:UDP-glucose dehydrogenase family protein [Sneathiella sp. HT1-7]|uniref:UDP-glucose dehydrogenase family protein n=1 Tax=Sneathiella sp. HT1-7 TaxID=2887192 RepID=UPI001D13C8B4|nr:UDP-glucose/GDP-mannose dehydrogenase family protein [Sneathiella sp. HT1-7]MCC3304678.1 UDP-glucose/GDP-mannose dehydrogenase family protein [Sneathiella sp. HT1-7]